jgi:hypothetical protein
MCADTLVAQNVGRTSLEFQLAPPASPLRVSVPIVVVPAITTPDSGRRKN